MTTPLGDTIDALREENARLRKALEILAGEAAMCFRCSNCPVGAAECRKHNECESALIAWALSEASK
jgi:hypothetical protein